MRCALVAAVLPQPRLPRPLRAQQASLAELRAQAPAPAMLRAAVVFAGHPQDFPHGGDGPKQRHRRRRRPLRNNQMRRLRRSRKRTGSLFPNPAPHAEACAEDVVEAFRNLQHAAVGQS